MEPKEEVTKGVGYYFDAVKKAAVEIKPSPLGPPLGILFYIDYKYSDGDLATKSEEKSDPFIWWHE